MKAVVYDVPWHWQLADLPEPEPGPGQVTLRVAATGVCGTDVHLDAGEFGPVYPLTPGHEIAGVVTAAGPGVTSPAPGELVAVDNMTACGHCTQCRRARPQFCATMAALGVTHPGGFAEYVLAQAGKCYPVGDLSPEVAVFAEPLACVVHGLDVLGLRPGSDVLVVGTGPTGLLLTQLLRQAGSGRVTVAGRTPFKVDLARAGGADETILMTGGLPGLDDAARDLAPEGFDVVVDATGDTGVLAACLPLAGIGGTLLVYGMAPEAAQLAVSPYDIFRRELTIKGSFAQCFSFDRAVAMLRAGRVSVEGMITHRFGLADYGAALDAVARQPACLKALVIP